MKDCWKASRADYDIANEAFLGNVRDLVLFSPTCGKLEGGSCWNWNPMLDCPTGSKLGILCRVVFFKYRMWRVVCVLGRKRPGPSQKACKIGEASASCNVAFVSFAHNSTLIPA